MSHDIVKYLTIISSVFAQDIEGKRRKNWEISINRRREEEFDNGRMRNYNAPRCEKQIRVRQVCCQESRGETALL